MHTSSWTPEEIQEFNTVAMEDYGIVRIQWTESTGPKSRTHKPQIITVALSKLPQLDTPSLAKQYELATENLPSRAALLDPEHRLRIDTILFTLAKRAENGDVIALAWLHNS